MKLVSEVGAEPKKHLKAFQVSSLLITQVAPHSATLDDEHGGFLSIDHKAWLFDHSRFQLEVASPLHRALSRNSAEPLREANLIQGEFADVHVGSQKEGTPV